MQYFESDLLLLVLMTGFADINSMTISAKIMKCCVFIGHYCPFSQNPIIG